MCGGGFATCTGAGVAAPTGGWLIAVSGTGGDREDAGMKALLPACVLKANVLAMSGPSVVKKLVHSSSCCTRSLRFLLSPSEYSYFC